MLEVLIVSCSDRKKDFSGPAVLVYDGGLFRVLRKNLPRVDLFILSARYGLIPAHQRIEPYDVTIGEPLITHDSVGNQWIDLGLSNYINVYTCMSQPYAIFLSQAIAKHNRNEHVFRIGEPGMAIGQMQQALKQWCLGKQGDVPEWIRLCTEEFPGT